MGRFDDGYVDGCTTTLSSDHNFRLILFSFFHIFPGFVAGRMGFLVVVAC